MHSVKYILLLFLCAGGCACKILGMGPGLVSMSPPRISNSLNERVRFLVGFCFFAFMFLFLVLIRFLFFVDFNFVL